MKHKRKMGISLLMGVIVSSLLLQNHNLFAANTKYPTSDATTDGNGITLKNSAAWVDENHTNNNYNANLNISINGIKSMQSIIEPVDVQIVHDISSSMDYICYSKDHYTFKRYEKITESLSKEQIDALKPTIETYLMNHLKNNDVTGKDNWISIAGMTDKDGKVFSKDAYLVPANSFYLEDDPYQLDKKMIYPTDFEKRWFVVDDLVASEDAGNNSNMAYWGNRFHVSKGNDGKLHSLSGTPDPTNGTYVFFSYFDRAAAIKANCKSYTTTANRLIFNFAEALFQANDDNHIAVNCFTESDKYVGEFTKSSAELKQELVNAFNSGGGQTNYEAGLITGRDSLNAHNDKDGRKKILIFISDGSPNRSFDDAGNIVESDNMPKLKAIADEMKAEGTEIYTVGFCISKWVNDTYLLPMAIDDEHSQFRTPEELDKMVEIYDFMQAKITEDTFIKSIVENTISQYYEVDKAKLPKEVTLIETKETKEDGSEITVQKIKYNVNTSDLDKNGVNTKVIPLILKEEYRNTNAYYPTNDEQRNGDAAVYVNLNGSKQNINVKTPWLPVNAKTYRIDTEVVNGMISDSISNIHKGENKVVTYAPNDGYELKKIYIDDKLIDVKNFESEYKFDNVTRNHKIKVIYEKIESNKPVNPGTPDNPNDPNNPTNPKEPDVDTPKTGDQSNALIWSIMAFLATTGLILLVLHKKRELQKSSIKD